MPQELSVSYQAVKTKVHRLMDAAVEGAKTESEIEECIARWWCLVTAGRPGGGAQIPMTVLERSNTTLKAIATTLAESKDLPDARSRPRPCPIRPATPPIPRSIASSHL